MVYMPSLVPLVGVHMPALYCQLAHVRPLCMLCTPFGLTDVHFWPGC